MLANLIVILAGVLVLSFIALLWLRQDLMGLLGALRQNEKILKKDLEKRRDLVPLLLEGAREGVEATDAWHHLVQKRSVFLKPSTLAQEFEFEQTLNEFLAQTSSRSITYLEAKKDIQEVTKLVEEQKQKLRTLALDFNQKRKQFPSSLASGIFGIREVSTL